MKRFFVITIFFLLIVKSEIAFASIVLDGSFDDWNNQPKVSDTINEAPDGYDISEVKWTFDVNNLYIYIKTNGTLKKYFYFINIKSEKGNFVLNVDCNSSSRFVDLNLYQSNKKFIWKDKGKWLSNGFNIHQIELYIPLKYLVYYNENFTLSFNINNIFDSVLDNGDITIMGIPTGINLVMGILLIFFISLILFNKKYRRII